MSKRLRFGLDDQDLIIGNYIDFCLFSLHPDWFQGSPGILLIGTKDPFPGSKVARAEGYHSLPFNGDIKSAGRYT